MTPLINRTSWLVCRYNENQIHFTPRHFLLLKFRILPFWCDVSHNNLAFLPNHVANHKIIWGLTRKGTKRRAWTSARGGLTAAPSTPAPPAPPSAGTGTTAGERPQYFYDSWWTFILLTGYPRSSAWLLISTRFFSKTRNFRTIFTLWLHGFIIFTLWLHNFHSMAS